MRRHCKYWQGERKNNKNTPTNPCHQLPTTTIKLQNRHASENGHPSGLQKEATLVLSWISLRLLEENVMSVVSLKGGGCLLISHRFRVLFLLCKVVASLMQFSKAVPTTLCESISSTLVFQCTSSFDRNKSKG